MSETPSPRKEPATLSNPRLRPPAAAAYLGLSVATLAKFRCYGGGPLFTKLGSAVVYEKADLDAFCDSQGKRTSTSDTSFAKSA